MTDVISTDAAFTADERKMLAVLAELMIPAAGPMPSAADDAILPGVLERLAANAELVSTSLTEIEACAMQQASAAFVELASTQQMEVVRIAAPPAFLQYFQMCVLSVYYQDDRAMTGIGLEPRPAWPQGYDIADTNWSRLEPVRARGPIWRDADI